MAGSTTEVLMPLMGEGITEATLVKWLKNPGDSVKKEEPLLEVSTDKVDTEIPSPAAGFLIETFAQNGETVPIHKVIAILAAEATAKPGASSASIRVTPGAAAGIQRPADLSPRPAARQNVPETADKTGLAAPRSSPLVRKMARSHNIDLANIAGTGLQGRITKRDFEAFASAVPDHAKTLSGVSEITGKKTGGIAFVEGRLATKIDGKAESLDGVPVRREKMTRMRTLIAEHMVRSVRTSPHVTTVFEIDLHKVDQARRLHREAFAAREGFNLTFTPFFVHAAVLAIKKHPVVNVSVDGDDILWKDQINIGVAVAIEAGLIVPVIRNAGELNLLGISRRLHDLAARARTKKLLPEDVQGGTFSITNPGMFGSLVSAPIINQPQVAILSIGAIIKRPVVIDDMIGIRPLVQVGLTFDHRVVDGAGGAQYLATFKEVLENFNEPLL